MTPPRPLLGLSASGAFNSRALQLKSAHEQLISWNPILLSLVRETRGRKGAGYDAWKEDPPGGMGPFRMRLYQKGGGSTEASETTVGHQERDTTWGLIMGDDVPLRTTDGEDGNVRISLLHPVHGRLRVQRLRALEASGFLYGWQGDAERISGTGPQHQPPLQPGYPLPPDPPPGPVLPTNPAV